MQNKNDIPQQELPRLLNLRQVAEILNLGLRTVARMQSTGQIPKPVRLGGSVRWVASDIIRFVSNGCPDQRKTGGAA